MTTPRVLVLMATCNGARWVDEQLQSVTTQRGVDVEVLVSDDHSTDGTLQAIRAFAAGHPNVSVLPAASDGGSAAANFLRLFRDADLGRCDHVALCDQDDVWSPWKLSDAVTVLSASGAALYSSAVTAEWPDGSRRVLGQSPRTTPYDFLFEGAGQGCTFVFRRAFFERVQRFAREQVESLRAVHYHDWLAYALARSWNETWVFDPRPGMRYRQHAGNDTGARGSLQAVSKRVRLIASGWYAGQVEEISRACLAASPGDPRLERFLRWRRCRSIRGLHLLWAGWLLVFGRRKGVDRLVLSLFAALRAV